MQPLTSVAPTTAERIRSAVSGPAGLCWPSRTRMRARTRCPRRYIIFCTTVPLRSRFPIQCATDGRVCGSLALLELTDYAPLPLREPVRSLVWVRGGLRQVPAADITITLDLIASECPHAALLQVDTPRCLPPSAGEDRYILLRLEIASVVVTDATGAEPVSIDDLLAAQPDPFCEIESSLLWHLDNAHGDVVARLVSRLPAPLRRRQIRPLGLDRYGVRFRVEGSDGDHDIRLPFHRPVDDMTGLSQAIRVLMGCPFVNGLRARP
jgi:hypothetical protein